MSRVFWMAVGAVGGVVAYRKGTQAIDQARELGALGTARVAASATSRAAGRTAHGLRRLEDIRDRRTGRLVIGSVEQPPAGVLAASPASTGSVAASWVPAEHATSPSAGKAGGSARPAAPSVVVLTEGDTGVVDGEPARPQSSWTSGSAGSATSRTTRPRRG